MHLYDYFLSNKLWSDISTKIDIPVCYEAKEKISMGYEKAGTD